MVPFRALAEALGAQVGYAGGGVTAEKARSILHHFI